MKNKASTIRSRSVTQKIKVTPCGTPGLSYELMRLRTAQEDGTTAWCRSVTGAFSTHDVGRVYEDFARNPEHHLVGQLLMNDLNGTKYTKHQVLINNVYSKRDGSFLYLLLM